MQVQPLRLLEFAPPTIVHTRVFQESGKLRWTKSGLLGHRYELRSSERCLATLTMRGFFRPEALGEAGTERWTIEPLESGTGKIVVRSRDSFREVGVFDLSLSDHAGILHFEDGQGLILSSDSWRGTAEFQTLSGEPLIRYRFRGLVRPSAEIELLGSSRHMPGLSWILMLGWCLIVGYL